MKILITGVSGKIGRIVAHLLHERGHEVLGIDRRRWPQAPDGIRVFPADIRKRAAEDVFRKERPEIVVHMATVSHVTTKRAQDRLRINLGGTRAVFDHAHKHGAKQVVFVGRHTYYGAAPDSALYHTEDEPPMAVSTYPELADLVAADLYAGSALWRMESIQTCVLRMVYTLGPSGQGTLANFLKGPRVPTVLGYDPLFHFMHEIDAAEAIKCAIDAGLRGVFNVAGPQPLPLSVLIEGTGRKNFPMPEGMVRRVLGRFGFPAMPVGAVEHVKFPIVIDDAAFRDATDYRFEFDEIETMRAFEAAGDV